jgi:hypothetical protein
MLRARASVTTRDVTDNRGPHACNRNARCERTAWSELARNPSATALREKEVSLMGLIGLLVVLILVILLLRLL